MSKHSRDREEEASRATALLSGKTVAIVSRHHPSEVGIEFTDGSRLFIDGTAEGIELSITGSRE